MSDSTTDRDPVEQLAEDFAARYRRGERPSIGAYTDDHPEHAAAIQALFPALLKLEQLKPASVGSPLMQPPLVGFPDGPPLTQVGDFRILREVGRGGMGVVYEAEQLSLGRHVALKVLLRHHFRDWKLLQRFQREVRAAARLHHSNIVPVFGLGEHHELPYYVMQFIQGLGLDEVLVELCRLLGPTTDDLGSRKDPGRQMRARAMAQALLADKGEAPNSIGRGRAYWVSVARIGVQAAEALGYAHQQGILHRDIKPANLLLDMQGTVWVTDFSLAKTVSDEDSLTPSGDAVGTFRYMAPEGFHGEADPRSDIYGLGLTLYELLTLHPAFGPADRHKLIKRVRSDVPAPRQLCPEVPADLETIVLRAIAADPGHRYSTGAELAEDLRRFIDDKPIKARRIGPVEVLWRWCRRNPTNAGLSAALLLVATGAFLAIFGLWQRAERQWGRAESNATAAREQRLLAVANFDKALEIVDQMLTRVAEEPLRNMPQMEPVRRQILEDALTFYRQFLDQRGDRPAVRLETCRAYQRVSEINLLMGKLDEAEAAQRAGLELLAGLVADFPSEVRNRQAMGEAEMQLARVLTERGCLDAAATSYRQAVTQFDPLVAQVPAAATYEVLQARGLQLLAGVLQKQGHHAEAEQILGEAIAHCERAEKKAPEEPSYRSALGAGLDALGVALERRFDLQASEAAFRRQLGLQEQLSTEFPAVAEYRHRLAHACTRLGSVLLGMGRGKEAETLHRRAVGVSERLTVDFPAVPLYRQTLATCCRNHGASLSSRNFTQEAETVARRGLALADKLATESPEVVEYRWELARHLTSLHDLLDLRGGSECESLHERASQLVDKLVEEAPTVPAYRLSQARLKSQLAMALCRKRRFREAEQALDAATSMIERAVPEPTKAPAYPEELAYIHHVRALLQADDQRRGEADAILVEGLRIRQGLASQHPAVVRFPASLAADWLNLARIRLFAGNLVGAESALRQVLEVSHALVIGFPEWVGNRRWYAPTGRRELVALLQRQKRPEEAEKVLRECQPLLEQLAIASIEGRYHLAGWYADFGRLCRGTKRLGEAELAWRQALASYEQLTEEAPSVEAYQAGRASCIFDLAGLLQRRGDLQTLRPLVEKAISVQEMAEMSAPEQKASKPRLKAYYHLLTDTLLGLNKPADAARLANDLRRLSEGPGDLANVAYFLARAARQLEASDRTADAEKHRANAEKILSEIEGPPSNPVDQNTVAWVFVMAPNLKCPHPGIAAELSTKATNAWPWMGSHWNTLGAAWYRANDFPAARVALKRGMAVNRGGNALDWLFLAMVEARSDNLVKAEEWFARSVAWIEQNKPADDELRMLRGEAAAVLDQVRRNNPPKSPPW